MNKYELALVVNTKMESVKRIEVQDFGTDGDMEGCSEK